MLFFFRQRRPPYIGETPPPTMGSSLLLLGLLCLGFGCAIIAAPELLAYLVAGFFIIAGCAFLLLWWRISR